MPYNVLILPLLGGYVLITFWNKTRFQSYRHAGYRLLFNSAVAGVTLLSTSYVLVRLAEPHIPNAVGWWTRSVPFDYLGTGLLSFILGSTMWWPLNLFWTRDSCSRQAVQQWGDYLEQLLVYALRDKLQVAITLKNRKFYIGIPSGTFDPAHERRYVRLLPYRSGYRNNELRFEVTTEYSLIYQEKLDDESYLDTYAEFFQVVIPVSEISSAKIFDPDVYEDFQRLGADVGTEDREEEPEVEEDIANGRSW